MHEARSTTLTGWGRTAPSRADVVDVDEESLAEAVASAGARGALVRGLGRSYGDAAQNGGGTVVRLAPPPAGGIRLDTSSGLVTAHAGVSFDRLLRHLVPKGFFVPVTPGTRFVTLGGAIAADVHGKNHHVDGTIGRHVVSLRLLTAAGEIVDCSRERHPELFLATVGGMGLTGHLLEVELAMARIPSPWIVQETERARDLDAFLSLLAGSAREWPFTVGWLDALAGGGGLGRGILYRGRWATA
ncbi:MAG TPA: FAD-binding oxidoreductase, partial [Ilumatobacteraceae bacterium]|nr:FAD-binding oxidoreductase [Ilumatobacteraceae bacterium]